MIYNRIGTYLPTYLPREGERRKKRTWKQKHSGTSALRGKHLTLQANVELLGCIHGKKHENGLKNELDAGFSPFPFRYQES